MSKTENEYEENLQVRAELVVYPPSMNEELIQRFQLRKLAIDDSTFVI